MTTMPLPTSGDLTISNIDKRTFLFPICSTILGTVGVVMQITAVSTSYWAHFKRERNVKTLADGIRVDPLYEEGHYGFWSVCLTIFDGQRLSTEDCTTNIAHFHPSSWRVFAGIIAIICAVLQLLLLLTIPLQVQHLRNGRPVYCKYRTLTRIKIVLGMVGVACAIMASVLFGINTHHKHYKEPKGWSFGLQIVVIVIQVFLLISSSAENVMAPKVDSIIPEPQFLFTLNRRKMQHHDQRTSLKMTTSSTSSFIAVAISDKNNLFRNESADHKLSRDNPIFIDTDIDNDFMSSKNDSNWSLKNAAKPNDLTMKRSTQLSLY